MRVLICLLIFIGLFSACVPEPESPTPVAGQNLLNDRDDFVYVINEGNFRWGNATLTAINLTQNFVTSDLYYLANQQPLGDVFQSMTYANGSFWMVVNNSGKVEKIDKQSLKSLGVIGGLRSPRYLCALPNHKAYISDLYEQAITVVDLSTLQIKGKIALPGWTEEMLSEDSIVWVTNIKKEYIYRINTQTDVIKDSIEIGMGGNSLGKDAQGRLWVYATGAEGIGAKLVCLNSVNKEIIKSFSFLSSGGGNLKISTDGQTLYWLRAGGVWKMGVEDIALPSEPWIEQDLQNAYGLGVHPTTGDIFIADAMDYVQAGKVIQYSNAGIQKGSWKVGVIPNGFLFQ